MCPLAYEYGTPKGAARPHTAALRAPRTAAGARRILTPLRAVVAFAEHVLLNARRLWQEFSLEQKQRLQHLLFPRGVTYADGEFRTVEMSPIFPMLRARDSGDESEASHRRVEQRDVRS